MEYSLQMLPLEERPRERLQRHGPEALSTTELIAILLGSGMRGKSVLQLSQELIVRFGSLKALAQATLEELCEVKGLGKAKATQLKAAFTLGLKISNQDIPEKYRIVHPIHAYHLIKEELEREQRERFVIILLDTKGCLICRETVSIGTLDESLVHPREVFYPAIRHKASAIILAHNHPSGDPAPSLQDYQTTNTLISTGNLLGIPIQDHIIVGNQQFISIRQKGGCHFV